MNLKRQFEQYGYVIAPNLLYPQNIESLKAICDRIYDQWLDQNYEAYRNNGLINISTLTHFQYFQDYRRDRVNFFNLITSAPLVKLLKELVGDRLYFHNSQLFFNPHDRCKQPYWHRDLQYSSIADKIQQQEQKNITALHVRIPLIAEQGLELIPHTHRRWDTEQERNVRFEANGHRNTEALPDAILIKLELGDVLVFHAQMIHRGHYHQNVQRQALDLCIGTFHPLLIDCFDELGLPTEQELEKITHCAWYKNAKVLAKLENYSGL